MSAEREDESDQDRLKAELLATILTNKDFLEMCSKSVERICATIDAAGQRNLARIGEEVKKTGLTASQEGAKNDLLTDLARRQLYLHAALLASALAVIAGLGVTGHLEGQALLALLASFVGYLCGERRSAQ